VKIYLQKAIEISKLENKVPVSFCFMFGQATRSLGNNGNMSKQASNGKISYAPESN
jgi:hypothetical protein